MKKIFLLVDYLNHFYSSREGGRGSDIGMNINRIVKYLKEYDYEVKVLRFSEVDVADKKFKNALVVYQSTEDLYLKYKDYIEDVLLALEIQGAILIPKFQLFRGHSNKAFQELLRKIYLYPDLSKIKSETYGCYEDFKYTNTRKPPYIVKSSEGAKSTGVKLVKDKTTTDKIVKEISKSFDFNLMAKDKVKSIIRPNHIKLSHHRNKFICQDFIADLKGDIKIVIYGNRYYTLDRKVRKNDFRASGSGILDVDTDMNKKILNYASLLLERFDAPYASFDIIDDNGSLDIVEFQFVTFGTMAYFDSKTYYIKENNKWVKKSDVIESVEKNIVDSLDRYIKKNNL